MKKNMILGLLTLLFVLVFAVEGRCILPEGDDPGRPPTKEQMEKLRQRIESIKMWKLTKALDLDEKTASKLFPLLNKYDKKRAVVERNIRESIRDLKANLRERNDYKLNNILGKLEQYHRELQNIKDEEWADLKRILSVEQQAKFILFLRDFEREIRDIIAQTKQRRREMMREKMRRD